MTRNFRLRWSRRVVGATATALSVGGMLGAGVASAGTSGAAIWPASSAPAVAVPWGSVGTGWVLTEYSAGTASKPKPTTLYVISPNGAKYPVYTWKASAAGAPPVVAWAGNKTEALLGYATGTGKYSELNLRTGKLTTVTLAGKAVALGYTLPTGQQILGETPTGTAGGKATVARYTQAGKLVKALVTEQAYSISAVYSANGVELAVSSANGLELVSNAGGVLRKLPVPGIATSTGCAPERWWNASTILATCYAKNSYAPQLWLVPACTCSPLAPAARSRSTSRRRTVPSPR